MSLAPLNLAQRIRLLRIAREAIYHFISRGKPPIFEESDPRLSLRQGVFVSLHVGERLRGCMGTFEGSGPLYQNVAAIAVNAASDDPRFSPVRMDEVPRLDIELSVLGPLTVVRPDEVEVGKHGVLVSKRRARGTLLPQVATQNHWTRDEFLTHTCQKAGLADDDWRSPDCQIQVFEADVFSESEIRSGEVS